MDRRALLAMTGEVGRGGAYVWSLRAKRGNLSVLGIKTSSCPILLGITSYYFCSVFDRVFF